ncbi:TPA: hypothetical protein ACPSKY_000238 [Legionella bozemanae]
MGKNKTPRFRTEPNPKKEPSVGKQFSSDDSGKIYWSFSLIDSDGPWGFHNICKDEFHSLVTHDFKSKEGINWSQLKSSGSHNVEINQLIKRAQHRLTEIFLDDRDELFSMRFSGTKRVWGIRDGNVFKVLWWDPNHEICPSRKKNT